jgi:competence protein ComEC
LNNLSLAAIILLLIQPTGLFEPGWQLSFTSVLGILIFTDRINFWIDEKVSGRIWLRKNKNNNSILKILSKPSRHIFTLFCVGISAWLGGAGILLYHFYTINPLTSLWTVIVFPLVTLILILGYLKILLSFILPSLSIILGLTVNNISTLLLRMVKLIADLDICQISIGHVPAILIIFYYCLLIFIVFVDIRRQLVKQGICVTAVLVLLLFLGGLKWQRTHRDELVFTTLDVGHGQAIVIQIPGNINLLFDSGSLYFKDVGQRIVVPFLNYNGINKIDAMFISHDDIDHVNGIPEIIKSCNVHRIYASKMVLKDNDEWGAFQLLKSFLADKGLNIQKFPDDINYNRNTNIQFLWPIPQGIETESLSDNDKSLVSLIKFGNCRILLCSDIEKKAQNQILQLYPHLICEVMVVPHHGLTTTLEENFIKKVGPQFCICSCDRRQFERIEGKRQDNKTGWYYTAIDGAIEITLSTKCDISVVRPRQE